MTIDDLIAAQRRAYNDHYDGSTSRPFALQEVNDHDLQAIATAGSDTVRIALDLAQDADIYASIETDYGKVSGDEDVPENALRVWIGDEDSRAFFDYTIRRERAVADAIATNPPPIPANAREKADLIDQLERAIAYMQDHGPTTHGALKSREMSTAITHAETALRWLDSVPVPD